MWFSKFFAASIFMGATSRNLNITSASICLCLLWKLWTWLFKQMPDVLKQKPFLETDGLLLGCGIWMWADVAAHHVIRQHLILPRLVRMVWQHEATDSGDSFMKPRISATNAGFILWKMFLAKNMPLLPLCFSIYLFWKYSWVLC